MRHAAEQTRQQVATRARCSLSMVALLEDGYVPKRSDVLPRVLAVLNDESPVGGPSSSHDLADGDGRHGP